MKLTLSAAEAEHLAGLGVVADSHGFLRSRDGSEVAPGTAAQMLKSSPRDSASGRFAPSGYVRGGQVRQSDDSPMPGLPAQVERLSARDFHRSYLGMGHQSDRPVSAAEAPVVSGGPSQPWRPSGLRQVAVDPRTGAPEAPGAFADPEAGMPGRSIMDILAGPGQRGIAAKEGPACWPEVDDLDPQEFDRGWLRGGHQAEAAHGIGGVPDMEQGSGRRRQEDDDDDGGGRGRAGVMGTAPGEDEDLGDPGDCTETAAAKGTMPRPSPIAAGQFRRARIPGEQRPSPGDRMDNNPWPAATPAELVYEEAAAGYQASRDQHRMDHTEITGRAVSPMAPAGWAPPGDVVQAPVVNPAAACGRSPGETSEL